MRKLKTRLSTSNETLSQSVFFFLIFIWPCWVLVAACRIFDLPCGMQDLFFFFFKLGYVAVECGI